MEVDKIMEADIRMVKMEKDIEYIKQEVSTIKDNNISIDKKFKSLQKHIDEKFDAMDGKYAPSYVTKALWFFIFSVFSVLITLVLKSII